MKNYKIFFLFILINVFTITSCDDYLDINDDPNNPVDAEINNLMPFSQAAIVGSLGMGTAGISELVSVYSQMCIRDRIASLPNFQNSYGTGTGFTYAQSNGSWGCLLYTSIIF